MGKSSSEQHFRKSATITFIVVGYNLQTGPDQRTGPRYKVQTGPKVMQYRLDPLMCHGGSRGDFSGSDIDTFPGRTRPASHAATDNIHTTRHSYVAI